MIKIANNLTNLIKTSTTANDVVNMNSFGGGVADYVTMPNPALGVWAARRAARSSAMADAVGMDPGWLLNHPAKTQTAAILTGALLGGGAGAGIGVLAEHPDGPLWGAGIGGLGGAIIAGLGARWVARDRMEAINKAVDRASKLKPTAERSLGIGWDGGPYNLARVEAEQAINSGGSKEKILQRLQDSADSQAAWGPVGTTLLASVAPSLAISAGLPLGLSNLASLPITLSHGETHHLDAVALRERAGKKNKRQ